MRRFAILAATVGLCLTAAGRPLDGSQSLRLIVSPALAPAPAFVRVQALIEPNDDNRSLDVVTESQDFYRSSRVELAGVTAPRLELFEYANLPPGTYDVRATLNGPAGKRATAFQTIRIIRTIGR